MLEITSQEIKKLASLSALDIPEAEIEEFKVRIKAVLGCAQKVAQAPLPDFGHEQDKNINIFVSDSPQVTDARPILQCSADVQEDYYVVPAIIEKK